MRLAHAIPGLALALVVSACTSSTAAKKTVTVVNTITSGPTSGTSSVVVVSPSASAKPTKAPPKTTASPTPTSEKPAPFVKIDPLLAECPTILSASDVKRALGAAVPAGSARKKDVPNPARGVVGKIRCYYPSANATGTAPVVVAFTQYASAAAAKKQVAITVDNEVNASAQASKPTVKGYPAELLLRSGGLIVVQYDSWTLGIATADKLAPNAKLITGLPVLATQVLTRVLKNG